MNKNQILSSLDITNWFCKKAEADLTTLSDLKIQHLLFLAQFDFIRNFKQFLYPSLCVCGKSGFYNPTIRTILSFGLPLMGTPKFFPETEHFLNSVWQKYGVLSEEKLSSYIFSLECWKRSYKPNEETIVNLLSFALENADKHTSLSSNQPKIMISQNGPVKVSAWHPRKLSSSNK